MNFVHHLGTSADLNGCDDIIYFYLFHGRMPLVYRLVCVCVVADGLKSALLDHVASSTSALLKTVVMASPPYE